jgi:hypothetical protein
MVLLIFTIPAIATANDLKFHLPKLPFLSILDPPCSNIVMLFKSSLPVTKPPQSLCLSLPLNSFTCDLMGSVCPPLNTSHQSCTSISSSPHPPMTQTLLLPPLLAFPNSSHPILLLQWSQLTLSHWLLGNQHCQPCPQPLLHPHTLTLLVPNCIPYPLPYLLPSMPSPSLPTPVGGRS